MFKELKRKFVIINMSLLSFVFVAIFVAIFMLTFLRGEQQLSFALNKMMNSPPPKPFPGEPRIATSLVVELNKNNEISKVFSFIELDKETVEDAVSIVLENNKSSGKIKSKDFNYSFLKRRAPFGTKIVFVDRTPLQESLKNILIIFIFIGGVSLIVLYLLSIYLANREIQPIKEAFKKQEQFVADASHELKTPLAIIKTNLDVISTNQRETVESQSRWIGFIYSQTERMSELVNDMLSLAKMNSLKETLCFESFNLSNLINGILLSFESLLFESNIRLETNLQEDVYFHGNKGSIERLINILIDNSIKNTPKEGLISVNLKLSTDYIEIIVKNTGKGIAPENIDKIFERFYREDPSRERKTGGFGLGLAIAKSIVEEHDGKIYAQSNFGADAAFTVKLPKP